MESGTSPAERLSYFDSLKGRVTLVMGLTLALVVVVMFISSYYGQRTLTAAMDANAVKSHSILLTKLMDIEQDIIQERLSRMLSRNVVDAFSAGSREELSKYIIPPYNRVSTLINLDRMTFFDTGGKVFLRVHAPANIQQLKPRPLVQDALAQRKILRGIDYFDDRVSISVVWPVYSGGKLIGAVEAAGSLRPIVEEFGRTVGGMAGFRPVESSGTLTSDLAAVSDDRHSSVLKSLASTAAQSASARHILEIDGAVWQAARLPLRGYDNHPLGEILVAENVTSLVGSIESNTLRNITVTALGVLAALLIALSIIGRNLSRLSDMISAIRHFASGDYTIKVPPQKRDEIGLLGEALDTMIKRVTETQNALMKSEKEAQEASRAKSAFLANMTHELRTPLNAVIGYGEILRDEFADREDERTTTDLSKIVTAARSLLRLIDEILEISKIEAGAVTVQCEKFNLNRLLEDVLAASGPELDQNQNELVVEQSKDEQWVFADPDKTARVMQKIIGNAAKFTQKGKVVVSVSHEDANWVEIAVKDSGKGIEQTAIGRLFQPFSQADESTTRRHGGTGLGLAIAKRLVQLMGGDIYLESEVGTGSTFRVRIPSAAGMSV